MEREEVIKKLYELRKKYTVSSEKASQIGVRSGKPMLKILEQGQTIEKIPFVRSYLINDQSLLYEVEKLLKRGCFVLLNPKPEDNEIEMYAIEEMPPEPRKKANSGCFIATAVYGSENSVEVISLRSFRDDYLLQSKIGQLIVKIYYLYSPYVAKFISSREILKTFIRKNLLDTLIKKLEKKT